MTEMDPGSSAPPPSRSATRRTVFMLGALVVVLAGVLGLTRLVSAAHKPGPIDDLAARVDCQKFEWHGTGFADSTEGQCTIDGEAITLVTFDANGDRDRWVSARLTFQRLATEGTTTWIVRGDRWAIETSSRTLAGRLADQLDGRVVG